MKLTKEINESRYKNGYLMNFIFCSRCVTFIDITKYEIGNDIDCLECHRDDSIVPHSKNSNKKFL